MNTRIARIEADIAEIKIDLAVIKARFATKADFAELKRSNAADLTGMKSSIAKARTSNHHFTDRRSFSCATARHSD
ncbi:hypothetical protein [Massilia sp. TWR1-2-2]|uniref:hypothetical protein n=1 Tax=Massilia sp. TWR1-2-2 TaxID=2804584 RepID=UPI003CEE14D5